MSNTLCEYRDVPLSWYVDKINARDPFALARWSDGEWPCVLGKEGCNTDKHPYSEELRADLTACLLDSPDYIMALQPLLVRDQVWSQRVHDWMESHGLAFDWVTADTFCHASIRGELDPFVDALANRGVILVGPERLDPMHDRLNVVGRVYTPMLNCHAEVERVCGELRTLMYQTRRADLVVSISASMSANVIVHRVHKTHPHATLLDLGSLWEPYVGVACRSYHAKVIERLRSA